MQNWFSNSQTSSALGMFDSHPSPFTIGTFLTLLETTEIARAR